MDEQDYRVDAAAWKAYYYRCNGEMPKCGPPQRTNEYDGYTPPKRGFNIRNRSFFLFLVSFCVWYPSDAYWAYSLMFFFGALAFSMFWFGTVLYWEL